jgi:cbb3-type cytochrome oxidase maturation protein
MESLYLLIPVAIVFCVLAIKLLLWAIDNGQYDDLDKEGWRILADEDIKGVGNNNPQSKEKPEGGNT